MGRCCFPWEPGGFAASLHQKQVWENNVKYALMFIKPPFLRKYNLDWYLPPFGLNVRGQPEDADVRPGGGDA